MMNKDSLRILGRLTLTLTVLVAIVTPSFGFSVNLVADQASVTMPDGASIPMWGYFSDSGQTCGTEPAWSVGPTIAVPAGDNTLEVNLRNCLTIPTSLIITGQALPGDPVTFTDTQGRTRVQSFSAETTPNGGIHTYTFNDIKPGSYLYKSGTFPALQVQMGLYGAMTANVGAQEAYPGVAYNAEVVLLYSEIDPALHATPAPAQPLNYRPKYFLVNGAPFTAGGTSAIGAVQQPSLLRFINAGLKDHTPMVNTGYLSVIAEDGNPYPYPHEQYSLKLVAGKTMDAVLIPVDGEQYRVFDRSLHLTTNGASGGGLMTVLEVTTPTGEPIAMAGPDQTGAKVGSLIQLDGSGSYDPEAAALSYNWTIDALPVGSAAALSDPAIASPTFTADMAGTYSFQLIVNDGGLDSAPDFVQVTAVNMPPLAYAGPDQAVTAGDLVNLDGSASSDPDSYPAALSFSWTLSAPAGSAATLATATAATASFTADIAGTYTAQLQVSDGDIVSSDSVVITASSTTGSNSPPVAYDDVASTTRNTPVTINLIANDVDADGSIDGASLVIVTSPTQGGQVTNNLDGSVSYTPKRGFRGTDTFTYKVSDNLGTESNVATVRVNVVRP